MEENIIINRIKKLLRHAASAEKLGSVAEAEVFTAKATELLMQYNIDRHKVILNDNDNEDEFAKYTWHEKISYKSNQSGDRWQLALIGVLTKYNLCSHTYNSSSKTFRVYGRMENVDIVVWMFNFLSIGLLNVAKEQHRGLPKNKKETILRYTYLKDFLIGCVVGIEEKLEAQKKEFEKKNDTTALMLYNAEALEKFIHTAANNLKIARKQKVLEVGEAYYKGVEVGRNYSITKPLTSGTVKETKLIN